MTLIRVISLVLTIVMVSTPATADFEGDQPSYSRMGDNCGEGASQKSYSSAEYTAALAAGRKAAKDAKRKGQKSREAAINQSIKNMEECKKNDPTQYTVPPIKNCKQFVKAIKDFEKRAVDLMKTGVSSDRLAEGYTQFSEAGKTCAREVYQKCIEPLDTIAVMEAVEYIYNARLVGALTSYKEVSTVGARLSRQSNNLTWGFCKDTDFACKGGPENADDPEFCERRVASIKNAMRTYVSIK